MIYFASDFHLGMGINADERERKICRWLDFVSEDASDIFLLGDLFDFWFEYKKAVPKGFVRFLGKLAELTDKGIRIHVCVGNHDLWMRDYLEKECGVRIFMEPEVHEFSGNKKNFHSPQNSYINNVLETKKGNPLTLSIIYAHIAQELHLPIKGVNLPSHFVLCYMDENNSMPIIQPEENSYGVLFYINPFSRGTIFNQHEITHFLTQLKIDPRPEYYTPCSNLEMIKRVITNLIFSYEKSGYEDKVEDLKQLIALF
jgi:hypothetical protein